jgi:hypothetical protein
MNDRAVPMDLSRTKAPVWQAPQTGQSQGRGPPRQDNNQRPQPWADQANATTNTPRGNFTCFSYSKPGHYAKNCHSKTRPELNLVDFDPERKEEYIGNEVPLDRVASTMANIAAMTFDKKQVLIAQMSNEGEQQDFPTV